MGRHPQTSRSPPTPSLAAERVAWARASEGKHASNSSAWPRYDFRQVQGQFTDACALASQERLAAVAWDEEAEEEHGVAGVTRAIQQDVGGEVQLAGAAGLSASLPKV